MSNYGTLRAGAGKGKIVFPKEMFPTDGFCAVHDDPAVRILIMEDAVRFAIVSIELVVVAKPFVADIKKQVSELTGTPEDSIWVHSTHVVSTPHTPGPKQKGPPSQRPPMSEEDKRKRGLFAEALAHATEEAARAAVESFQPAVLNVGSGKCNVNCSCREQDVERRLRPAPLADGVGLTNKTMTILRFSNLDGKPIGFLLNYDIKPCALDNAGMSGTFRKVSSDVPGKACAVVEEAFGAPVLYCMGATGDQHPREQAIYDTTDINGRTITIDLGVGYGLQLVERYGAEMGNDAVAIINSMSGVVEETGIAVTGGGFEWENALDPKKPAPTETEMSTIAVQVARIGDIAFVSTNPEISCPTEMEIQKTSPFKTTLLITMVNGPMRYMPDKTAFELNTREAQLSFAAPGAAEEFTKVAVTLLNQIK